MPLGDPFSVWAADDERGGGNWIGEGRLFVFGGIFLRNYDAGDGEAEFEQAREEASECAQLDA